MKLNFDVNSKPPTTEMLSRVQRNCRRKQMIGWAVVAISITLLMFLHSRISRYLDLHPAQLFLFEILSMFPGLLFGALASDNDQGGTAVVGGAVGSLVGSIVGVIFATSFDHSMSGPQIDSEALYLIRIAGGLFGFLCGSLVGILCELNITQRLYSVSPFTPAQSPNVLDLCRSDPTVTRFQEAVARQWRVLVNGEIVAMRDWIDGSDARERNAKERAAFEQLKSPVK